MKFNFKKKNKEEQYDLSSHKEEIHQSKMYDQEFTIPDGEQPGQLSNEDPNKVPENFDPDLLNEKEEHFSDFLMPLSDNEPLHNKHEYEKESAAAVEEAASGKTDEKDAVIEELKMKIQELEDENLIIPALKAEVKRLNEEIDEYKQTDASEVEDHEKGHLVDLLGSKFRDLEGQLSQLSKDFTLKIKIDESKEKIIDNLHRELQSYKDDKTKDILKPFINDLILMADRTKKIIMSLMTEEVSDTKKFVKILHESIQDIEDILYRQGIEAIHCDGNSFDVKRQQIVKTIKTDDESKDKQVAEVVGKGYEWDGKLLRHEKVNIYVYEKI
ncbi:MAG: nucleotide exchange factor GrpE [Bacillota bacterium]